MNVEFNPDDSDDDALGSLPQLNGVSSYKDRPGSLRGDGYGGGGYHYSAVSTIQSHNYEPDESEVWRAYVAQAHFMNRGQWWTTGKKRALKRWILTFLVGVIQALVAASCNFVSRALSKTKYEYVYELLNPAEETIATRAVDDDLNAMYGDDNLAGESTQSAADGGISAFWAFCLLQTLFAAIASIFVWIEPV